MKINSPSEKLVEMLFTRYLFQLFPPNDVLLFAPTTREEYSEGYDTKIIGEKGCFELCLQFKTPNKTQEGLTIRLNDHQHITVLESPSSSFYLSHTFHNLEDINECQRTASGPNDFLRRCLAVDAKYLNFCTNFIQFKGQNNGNPSSSKYKMRGDGNIKKAPHDVHSPFWLRGDELIDAFRNRKVGSPVKPKSSRQAQDPLYAKASRETEAQRNIFGEERDAINTPTIIGEERANGAYSELILLRLQL